MKENIRQLKIQRKKKEPNIQSSAMALFVNHIARFISHSSLSKESLLIKFITLFSSNTWIN